MNGYIMLGEMVDMTVKDLDIELKDFRGTDHEKELIERVLNQLNSMKNIIKEALQAEIDDDKQSNKDK